MYIVSQKVAPPNTFCNNFTQIKYISVKFCQFIASLYPHIRTNFSEFILIFNKTALIFLGVLIVFRFKFRVSASQTALTSSLLMSGPNSPNLNPLDYQVWGNAEVLSQAATGAKNSSRVLKMHFRKFGLL